MESTMLAAMEILPVGFRFHPSEDELLQYYLKKKNLGQGDRICVIPELDLCRWEPEDLPAKFRELSIIQAKDEEYWFFCEQDTGRNAHRSTRGGFWKKTGKTREVKSRDGKQVIGQKKILPFHRGNCSNNTATNWVMHEYLLPINALDGLVVPNNRKNYVLCIVKRNLEKHDDTNLSHEFGCDESSFDMTSILELEPDMTSILELEPDMTSILELEPDMTSILELEPDNGFHQEELIQAMMRSLDETLCRNTAHGVNQNRENILEQFPDHFFSSFDSSSTPLSFGRESIDMTPPFSNETSDTLAYVNEMLIDEDEHPARIYMMQADTVETLHHEHQDFIMQSKQTPKVESFHGYVPIDEKKGIVEDDSDESTASSVQVKTHQQKIKKETPKPLHYVPSTDAKTGKPTRIKINKKITLACSSRNDIHRIKKETPKPVHYVLPTDAKAGKITAAKINEEIASACSSIHNSRQSAAQLQKQIHSAISTRTKPVTSIVPPNDWEKAAREKKSIIANVKPVSSSSSTCSSRKSPCNSSSLEHMWNVLVAIMVLVAIFFEIFNF